MYCYFESGDDRSLSNNIWTEGNMFADPYAASAYKRSCGGHWEVLIRTWEQRQLLAISGDRRVPLLVYRCHEGCGGLGDRQRGMLTTFLLAVVLSRGFLIDSEIPIPLRHYFHFANPDLHWVFDEALVTDRSVLEESFMNTYPPIGDYAEADLSYYDAFDVVIQKNNFWKPLSILQNPVVQSSRWQVLQEYDEHALAGCALNYLLVPERHLMLHVKRTIHKQAELNRGILAVQIRSGDNQEKNDTIIDDLAAIFLTCIDEVQQASHQEYAVFLSSDSDQVASRIASVVPDLLTFPGPILHVDGVFGASDSPDEAFQKVLLDHLMLSSAAELIISRSGFAEYASLRGFKAYRHPQDCSKIMHYTFPQAIPRATPGVVNSVNDILGPPVEGGKV